MYECGCFSPTAILGLYLETPSCVAIAKHIHIKHVHKRLSELNATGATDGLGSYAHLHLGDSTLFPKYVNS